MTTKRNYEQRPEPQPVAVNEQGIEDSFICKLCDLKYTHRPEIRDRAALEANFRQKFEGLNRVRLTEAEFARLLDDLVSPDVFKNSVRLRGKNDFTRDDGTPLSYTLVNIRDWCKNDFEVVHQLRINTDYSHPPATIRPPRTQRAARGLPHPSRARRHVSRRAQSGRTRYHGPAAQSHGAQLRDLARERRRPAVRPLAPRRSI